MTTLAEPHSPAPTPSVSHTPAGPVRYVAIRANLLPSELMEGRHSRRTKQRLVAGLVVLVAALAGWYLLSVWATSGARSDLTTAQLQTTQLHAEQHKYQPVVDAKNQVAAVDDALQKLMTGDLSWKDMLTTLRTKAGNGITLTSVTGTMTSGAATGSQSSSSQSSGLGLLNSSGKPTVGTLVISGTAPSKQAVASYVNQLSEVTGLTAVLPTSVTPQGADASFSISALITTDALGGRYAASTAGGGN